MKKTLISLATASLIASSAMAADKGIDIVVSGQATVYYETHSENGNSDDQTMFDQDNSAANVGIQLNLGADLGNNFTFGSQLTYLGTAGLEKNLVAGVKQHADDAIVQEGDTTSEIALTKIFIAKKIGNTTVKIGRQELPKSLSPLAFSEGWNVYKNTFDAILVVNSDIPDTTVVAAYVSGGTGISGLESTNDLGASVNGKYKDSNGDVNSLNAPLEVNGEAYMLTIQNKSIPMTTVTASYYTLDNVNGDDNFVNDELVRVISNGGSDTDAYWLDIAVADKSLPMGLKVGAQVGHMSTDDMTGNNGENFKFSDTTVWGLRASFVPMSNLTLSTAYTTVNAETDKLNVAFKNTGTGVKTPLFTQMIYNQDAIALDATTLMVKGSYNAGTYGVITAAYGNTDAGAANLMGANEDYQEFDLTYKVNYANVQYFAAYVYRQIDNGGNMNATSGSAQDVTEDNRFRVWARYNF